MKRICIMYDKIDMLFVVWHCWHNVSFDDRYAAW